MAAMTGRPALACAAVTVEVPGRTLVRDLTLDLPAGRLLVVLGRSSRHLVRRAGRSMEAGD